MKIGYVRVSTDEQNLDRQTDLMAGLGVQEIYQDKASGKDSARPGLKKLLAFVRKGDEVFIESISRLARSTRELLDIVEGLERKGVVFISLKEALDTRTPQGRFVLTIFAALATLERETILERQREGIASARSRGKHLGRPNLVIPVKWSLVVEDVISGKVRHVDAMRSLGLKKTSYFKLLRQEVERRSLGGECSTPLS